MSGHYDLAFLSHGTDAEPKLDRLARNNLPESAVWAAKTHKIGAPPREEGRPKHELPQRGYSVMTPPETRSPIISCALQDAPKKLAVPLETAKLKISVSANLFRLSPPVQNDMRDIDRFFAALPHA